MSHVVHPPPTHASTALRFKVAQTMCVCVCVHAHTCKQDYDKRGNICMDVTMRPVHDNIVAMEMRSVLHILGV